MGHVADVLEAKRRGAAWGNNYKVVDKHLRQGVLIIVPRDINRPELIAAFARAAKQVIIKREEAYDKQQSNPMFLVFENAKNKTPVSFDTQPEEKQVDIQTETKVEPTPRKKVTNIRKITSVEFFRLCNLLKHEAETGNLKQFTNWKQVASYMSQQMDMEIAESTIYSARDELKIHGAITTPEPEAQPDLFAVRELAEELCMLYISLGQPISNRLKRLAGK